MWRSVRLHAYLGVAGARAAVFCCKVRQTVGLCVQAAILRLGLERLCVVGFTKFAGAVSPLSVRTAVLVWTFLLDSVGTQ